jgi:hypothetical protein
MTRQRTVSLYEGDFLSGFCYGNRLASMREVQNADLLSCRSEQFCSDAPMEIIY